MEFWYWLLSFLPFEWSAPGQMLFMKNALLAIIIIAPVFGILGTMIVNNRMAFFSDALGHGAFTGVAIGGLVGIMRPVWSAVVFSILFAIGIAVVKNRTRMANDTIIGVFSSTAVALGIFIATAGGKNFAKLNTYLVGNILSISPEEIGLLIAILLGLLVLWIFVFNKLLVASVNQSLAESRGIHTFWIELVFSAVIAVIVTISMSWIGLLVINSFLVLPASSARNISRNQRQYHLAAVGISLFSGITGLISSYYLETASSATIVMISAAIFFITFFARKRFS